MRYKITVQELEDVSGERYPVQRDIYEQQVDALDLHELICAVNGLQNTPKLQPQLATIPTCDL